MVAAASVNSFHVRSHPVDSRSAAMHSEAGNSLPLLSESARHAAVPIQATASALGNLVENEDMARVHKTGKQVPFEIPEAATMRLVHDFRGMPMSTTAPAV